MFIAITHGKIHDVEALDHVVPEPGRYIVMDRIRLSLTSSLAPEAICSFSPVARCQSISRQDCGAIKPAY
jgi:hypothetical protein